MAEQAASQTTQHRWLDEPVTWRDLLQSGFVTLVVCPVVWAIGKMLWRMM